MRLLINYLSLHLKIKLQYKLSFIFSVISQALAIMIELYVIKSLFVKFSLLKEFEVYKLYMGFSIVWLGFSIAQMFGRGFDKFSKIIIDGSFDLLLIRPQNIFLQIIGSEIAYEKLGKILTSAFLFGYSCIKIIHSFNILTLIVILLMIIGSTLIFISIYIIGSSICFYTIQGIEIVNIFTDGTKQLNQYPISIYNKMVKYIFTYFIPITLINYYPVNYLFNNNINYLCIILPIVACLTVIPAIIIFDIGLKKYKSTGS